jgi:cobalamin synthase
MHPTQLQNNRTLSILADAEKGAYGVAAMTWCVWWSRQRLSARAV